MSKNLINRIITSIILLIILSFGLFLNKLIGLYLIIIVSIISYFEFSNLIKIKFRNDRKKASISIILSVLYLAFFVYAAYDLYNSSLYIFVLILMICIFSDTGGYIVGKLIGGKKLTKLSPKKTISGSVGSFVFSLFPIIFMLIFEIDYQKINILLASFLCLFLSLICQLGDLFISYFKRQAKVKDTGSLLPGHGGLLDRIDGFIFVLPVTFILFNFLF